MWRSGRVALAWLFCSVCSVPEEENEPTSTDDSAPKSAYHGIIIDAGSTGSRIWIFTWSPLHCDLATSRATVTPTVLASHQVKGGLSSVNAKLNDTLTDLLSFAEETLKDRQSDWHRFPVYFLATAGFRRMRPEQREGVLQTVRLILAESHFHSEPDFVRILSGEEEGAYGWLAINSDMGNLEDVGTHSVGVLDLGGASMQITFVPEADRSVLQHSFPVHLQGRQSNLYSASYLQFGLREAHRLLQRQLIGKALVAEQTEVLEHPCLPRGSNTTELLIGDEAAAADAAAVGASALAPLTAT